jgi:hypothetical protein
MGEERQDSSLEATICGSEQKGSLLVTDLARTKQMIFIFTTRTKSVKVGDMRMNHGMETHNRCGCKLINGLKWDSLSISCLLMKPQQVLR